MLIQLLLSCVVNALIVMLVVLVHYEFLYRMTLYLERFRIKHNYRIVVGVWGALIAHTIEIWIFAIAYYAMIHHLGWGNLSGNFNSSLLDIVYFSFTTYTTLGFGDIEPIGLLRFLVGIESLTGLVLITWTASFLYLEMRNNWINSELK